MIQIAQAWAALSLSAVPSAGSARALVRSENSLKSHLSVFVGLGDMAKSYHDKNVISVDIDQKQYLF